MAEHFKKEGEALVGAVRTLEDALRAHHLATADPEPHRDGPLTGPAHEEKYGLERAENSAAQWRAAGVHPTENRALVPGEDGYDDGLVAVATDLTVQPGVGPVETNTAGKAPETTSAPRAKS